MSSVGQSSFILYFPLVSAVFILALGFFVLFKNKKSKVNRIFFLLTLISSLWDFFTYLMFISVADQDIVFWDKMIYLVVSFFPPLQYHFSILLTRASTKRKIILLVSYVLGFIFAFLSPTNLIVDGIFRYKWGVHTLAQPLHNVYLSFFIGLFALSIINFYKHYLVSTTTIEKRRAKYYIFSFSVLNVMGTFAYFPAYQIGIYPISLTAPLSFTVLMTYAIVSYRLMDVKFVLRQSVVYITSLVATVFFAVILKYNIYFFFQVSENYWVDLFLISTALFVFPLLKNYCYHLANKYFFTSLYDSKKVIAELSEKLSSTLEPHLISQAVEESLTKSLHPKAMALFDFNEATEVFDIKFNYGFKLKSGNLKVGRYILQNYFFKKSVLLLDDLHPVSAMRVEPFLKEFRDKLGIEVIVPMIIKNKAVGFLALGTKESGDAYNNEDIQLLSVIGTQVAMSLENSWLYEETRNFNIKLTKEIDKATKDLRRANAELKRLDAAKSEFISIASHQLRTPLTVIKGYSSMMLEGSFGHMPEPIEGNIRKIYESNERLINLVEDLLNISRIESGRMKFDFALDSLESVVDSVVEEMMIAAKNKNLTLNYEKPDRLTPKVKLDKMKLRQVIINIIDNAVKYTNEGSVTVKISEQNGYVRCSVTDTGMGISATDLQHLFKKFSRGESISLVHTEGTGLGLYVGKMMIEEHGGRIWAESMGEGKGSTFAFDLPVFK